ncbi:MAG: hypothetical protein RBT34_00310 [Anaerolineaceae bacterium]|nr:hypothetical protein [Anaerolineaceae bacterium]
MKYLIMNAHYKEFYRRDNVISTASEIPIAGVLQLDYKTVCTMENLINHAVHTPVKAIPYPGHYEAIVKVVSVEFTKPRVTGLVNLSDVKLTPGQRKLYDDNGYVIVNKKPPTPSRPFPDRVSSLFITMYKNVYWEFSALSPADDQVYHFVVNGPRTTKWGQITNSAIKHLLAEAKKSPITWDDARHLLTYAADYPGWKLRNQTFDSPQAYIVDAIREVLANPESSYYTKLTPVEIAQLETIASQYQEVES